MKKSAAWGGSFLKLIITAKHIMLLYSKNMFDYLME